MEKANYKSLVLKLFGAGLGLVVMLVGAVTLGQNFLADKSSYTISAANSESSVTSEELEMTLSMNEEFKIVVENATQRADIALQAARLNLAKANSDLFKQEFILNSETIDALTESMVKISGQINIPTALKVKVLSELEHQLEITKKEMSELDDYIVAFSYKKFLPQSKYPVDGKCVEADTEKNTKGNRKGSIAAFYWI